MGSPHGDRGREIAATARLRALIALAASVTVGAAVLVTAPAARAANPALTWVARSPSASPPARFAADIATDTATGQVVLFGGYDSGGLVGDTWTWNGTTWTQQFPSTSPSASAGDTMATDPTNGHALLFDGSTWEWSGSNWVALSPAHSPPGRLYASMATDASTREIVLFGGFNASDTNPCQSDTWTWNGFDWTQQSPSSVPPAREAAGMSADPTTGHVVLFGGNNCTTDGYINDTWTWDGTNWTQQSPSTSPSTRGFVGFAADPVLARPVLFGGFDGSSTLSDTWTWTGSNWSPLAVTTSPSARGQTAMATDPNGRLVLFGGNASAPPPFGDSPLGDTWSLGPSFAVTPTFGPQGTVVQATAVGPKPKKKVKVSYVNGHKHVLLCSGPAAADSSFSCAATIPSGSAAGQPGDHLILGTGGGRFKLSTEFLLQAL